ncbi:S8 family serine peptidase [Streptomyces sp. NPDC020875]|uniref:S8 family peptidase n=1 Tax=Streptomyces sp. NPDC020875 TaxID=3154898 RepID=UPI0033F0A0F1
MRFRRSLLISVAVVTGAALTVGAGAPPGGGSPGGRGGDGTGKARGPGAVAQIVTLVTGDRVHVGAKGEVIAVRRAEGREGMPFRTHRAGGRTYVVPHDAQRLIAAGKVDRQLFDITGLTGADARRAYRDGVKLIVSYGGASAGAAKAGVRASAGVKERRGLPAVNAEALTVEPRNATAVWDALTSGPRSDAKSTTAGVTKIWLDAVVKASLDKTTTQIGAPAAWAGSYDGTGVKIAVLDTGIDGTHPDLAGRVTAEQNFSDSADAKDRQGHGTHVASTAAGRGVKDSRFKGVAPGATLLNGKVLDDFGGGSWSGIMAGIDWAVAQGADVVNMSLGGYDSYGVDPVEALVNKYTAEKGVLFAIAAGNSGPYGSSVGTPGTAAGALTVGAVDDNDELAFFSSRGPRADDGGIKPDVTAPGVDVTAAAAAGTGGQSPPGYTGMSGTSMASPHVAGAAAILKQKNPTWTGDRIKAALAGSAKPGPYSVWEQGTGRIAVDRAVAQRVVAEPTSLTVGTHQWPHDDAAPATERLTYRNEGPTDIDLDLAVTGAKGPDGQAAPAGLFKLGTQRITVPAGGTATADVTSDIAVPGAADGRYQAVVTATGDGGRTALRTAVATEREPESYSVTVKMIGRDGAPDPSATAFLGRLSQNGEGGFIPVDVSSGERTVRLPKGEYVLSGDTYRASGPHAGYDILVQPGLVVDRDVTAVLDTRTTKPVALSVPDGTVAGINSGLVYEVRRGQARHTGTAIGPSGSTRTAHAGPALPAGSMTNWAYGNWQKPGTDYNTATRLTDSTRFPTGVTKRYKKSDFAKADVGLGASVPGKWSDYSAYAMFPGVGGLGGITVDPAQGRRTSWLAGDEGITWDLSYLQLKSQDPFQFPDSAHAFPQARTLKAGKTYRFDFNTGAHGPALATAGGWGVFRTGDTLQGYVPFFSDGRGNLDILSDFATARTTLHRGSTEIGAIDVPPSFGDLFTLPADPATYTLATSVTRSAEIARVGTRVDASWTFRSQRTDTGTEQPFSVVRFTPNVALDSTAPAGKTQTFPVTVQGSAAGKNLKSLAVQVSYDGGKKWQKVTVKKGQITVKNPAKGKGIVLRAQVADKSGNKASVTIHNAYLGR